MADGMVRGHRFGGYTDNWKEEIRGAALENLLRGILKFDETKGVNPFAFGSMIAKNAGLGGVDRERRNHEINQRARRRLEKKIDYVDLMQAQDEAMLERGRES